jgi:hypothetical protein
MLKKIIITFVVISVLVSGLLPGVVAPALANGIVYRNVTPNAPAGLLAPAAAASSSVQFPGGIFLGTPSLPEHQALSRMTWGVVAADSTIANPGSGDWSVSLGMGSSVIQFLPAYSTEPTCIFNPINTLPLGSSPVYVSMGATYYVQAEFFNAGGNYTATRFSFVCFQ